MVNNKINQPPTRYIELDSIRGIASSTVILHHCLISFSAFLALYYHEKENSNQIIKMIYNSPLHIFFAGHEAVILFFILSGFVLSLSFFRGKKVNYVAFMIKRICRIYIPYIITILISAILFYLLQPTRTPELSTWFNEMWSRGISLREIISYVFMIGWDTNNLDTTTWSLVHEMRISLFFPIMMILIVKSSWKKSLLIGALLFIPLWLALDFISNCQIIGNKESIRFIFKSLGLTFYYSMFFLIGALLSKNLERLSNFYTDLSRSVKCSSLVIAILFYTVEWTFPGIGSLKYSQNFVAVNTSTAIIDFSMGIAVIAFFIASINSKKINSLLQGKFLVKLGRISYSLYLIHPVVLITVVTLFKNIVPLPLLIISVPIVSYYIAILFYKFVEQPSAKLGKMLANSSSVKNINVVRSEQ